VGGLKSPCSPHWITEEGILCSSDRGHPILALGLNLWEGSRLSFSVSEMGMSEWEGFIRQEFSLVIQEQIACIVRGYSRSVKKDIYSV